MPVEALYLLETFTSLLENPTSLIYISDKIVTHLWQVWIEEIVFKVQFNETTTIAVVKCSNADNRLLNASKRAAIVKPLYFCLLKLRTEKRSSLWSSIVSHRIVLDVSFVLNFDFQHLIDHLQQKCEMCSICYSDALRISAWLFGFNFQTTPTYFYVFLNLQAQSRNSSNLLKESNNPRVAKWIYM